MEQIKWTLNSVPKNHRQKAEEVKAVMSVEETKKARAFHRSVPQYNETPLQALDKLAKQLGVGGVYVKDESFRFGLNSFKALGGAYAIARYVAKQLNKDILSMTWEDFTSEETRDKIGQITFFTATDGNHGRGVAWAARQLGQKCVVYMPKGSSEARLNNIRKEGAIAEITEFNYDDTIRMTAAEAKKAERSVIVQDTSWEGYEEIPTWIMQGYGVMALEADEQLNSLGYRPTHVFVQAGVGAMAGSAQGYFANKYPDNPPKVAVVEANAADCFFRSAIAADGKPRIVGGDMNTIMAGLACGEPYITAWELFKDNAACFVSCPDWVTELGMRMLAAPLQGDPQVVSGESGAVTTGFLTALTVKEELKELKEALSINEESRIIVFSTEGNTDPGHYRQVVWDPEGNVFSI